MASTLENHKVCGDCTACCKINAVEDFEKKAGHDCNHTKPEGGCDIWGLHPTQCQEFKCLWLKHTDLNALWRPDVAGFVLSVEANGTTVYLDIDPDRPNDWRREPYLKQLKLWSQGITRDEGLVIVRSKDTICVITPDEDLYLKAPKRGEILETGMEITLFGRQPYARIVAKKEVKSRVLPLVRLCA